MPYIVNEETGDVIEEYGYSSKQDLIEALQRPLNEGEALVFDVPAMQENPELLQLFEELGIAQFLIPYDGSFMGQSVEGLVELDMNPDVDQMGGQSTMDPSQGMSMAPPTPPQGGMPMAPPQGGMPMAPPQGGMPMDPSQGMSMAPPEGGGPQEPQKAVSDPNAELLASKYIADAMKRGIS